MANTNKKTLIISLFGFLQVLFGSRLDATEHGFPLLNAAGRYTGWGWSHHTFQGEDNARFAYLNQRHQGRCYPSSSLMFPYSPHYQSSHCGSDCSSNSFQFTQNLAPMPYWHSPMVPTPAPDTAPLNNTRPENNNQQPSNKGVGPSNLPKPELKKSNPETDPPSISPESKTPFDKSPSDSVDDSELIELDTETTNSTMNSRESTRPQTAVVNRYLVR